MRDEQHLLEIGGGTAEAVRQAHMEGSLNAGTLKKLQDFVELLDSMRAFAAQSDTVAATIEHVYERTGLLTALLGAPYFVYLLFRSRLSR